MNGRNLHRLGYLFGRLEAICYWLAPAVMRKGFRDGLKDDSLILYERPRG